MAATSQAFLCHLPQDIIEMLQRTATERHATPDAIVAEALRFALQPIRQQALQQLQHAIRQQQGQSEAEIQAHIDTRLADEEQQRLSQLLERNRTATLSAEERAELQRLFDRIEAVATEKAAAIWLLSGRAPVPDATR